MQSTAEWIITETDASKVRQLQTALGLCEPVARALVNRGVSTGEGGSEVPAAGPVGSSRSLSVSRHEGSCH